MLEIIENCREAESSEVKRYVTWSVAKCNKAKWSERSKVKWNEVKWSAVYGKGGGTSLYGKGL